MSTSPVPTSPHSSHAELASLSGLGQQLFESAPDAVIIIDRGGTIRLANAQAVRLFGYAREELMGGSLERLIPERVRDIHPFHRAKYFSDPATRPMGAGLELTARRKDGTEFPVDIALSSLETDEGVLVSAAIRDVTDWVQANREKETLAAQLRLHQAQRMESIGRLAGGVAHDFNNILAAIMSYSELISEGIRRLPGAEDASAERENLLHDVEQITLATERAAELTHQLLIFSRREVVQPEVLSVNDTISEMEKLLRRTIGEDIRLTTSMADGIACVEMDRGQLEQILMNLVVNARDAMPTGGRLEIRTAEVMLDDEFRAHHRVAPGRYVLLSVSDTGRGMTTQIAGRAFEPFFTTKEKGHGSGLGLATVYGIVTQAEGHISIYSEPGTGTTVKTYLPATEATPSPSPLRSPVRASASRGETILLVEDEEMVREAARRLLSRQGYVVIDAPDPATALTRARDHPGPIDLLLTDVIMPGMNGKELAARLSTARQGMRVVYMSGYSQDVIAHHGAVEDGVVLIEKPFNAQILLGTVREALDGARG